MSPSVAEEVKRFPPDCLYAPDQDMWARFEADGTATIGATHLIVLHGQFIFFAPRPVGTAVARDRSLGVMETAKTAVAIHAPLSCKIIAVNAAVERDAQLIERDPYHEGWLFRIEPTAPDERALLLDAAAYRAWLEPRLDRFKPPIEDSGFEPPRSW